MPTESTQQQLLDAAILEFSTHGYHRATVRDICARAGANVAAVNYHFTNKDGLYRATFDAMRQQSNAQNPFVQMDTQRDFHADRSASERLHLFIRTTLEHSFDEHGNRRPLAMLMIHEMLQPTEVLDYMVQQSIRRVHGAVKAMVRDLMPGRPSPKQVSMTTVSIMSQVYYLSIAKPLITRLEPALQFQVRHLDAWAKQIHGFALQALGHDTS